MAHSNERSPHILSIPIGTQDTTITLPGAYFRKHSRIKQAWIIDQAGVVASNSNYLIVSLNDLASNVYATYETKAANQGALTAMTPGQMNLPTPDIVGEDPSATGIQTEVDVPAGTTLQVVITAGGTVTFTDAVLQIEYYPA